MKFPSRTSTTMAGRPAKGKVFRKSKEHRGKGTPTHTRRNTAKLNSPLSHPNKNHPAGVRGGIGEVIKNNNVRFHNGGVVFVCICRNPSINIHSDVTMAVPFV